MLVGRRARRVCAALAIFISVTGVASLRAQVSPPEILNPELRQLETTYLQQLKALHHSITGTKFPYAFSLARYVAAKPTSAAAHDTRGIEFVHFQGRVVLKTTGTYSAAFRSSLLTANERATRVFSDVFLPILRLVRQELPEDVACDDIGFEISYHVLGKSKAYEFEGSEILVGVFARSDAFALAVAESDAARQEIVNRSRVYLDGKEFGLAVGAREPVDVETLERGGSRTDGSHSTAPGGAAEAGSGSSPVAKHIALPPLPSVASASGMPPASPAPAGDAAGTPSRSDTLLDAPKATQEDADRLQAKYQVQLDALAKEGLIKFHFVDYAPPSFVVFHDRVALQLTLRNPARFDRERTSIYKRAAQSFDLFLAPELKDLLSRISTDVEFSELDITVLSQSQSPSTSSPEAIEFICPLRLLREFADARITNQELINESIVLVNGVRIALNLQLVE